MRFKVGDVVVLVARPKTCSMPTRIPLGTEGVVFKISRGQFVGGDWYDCMVDFGGDIRGCHFSWIAPKRPPALERGSWSEIERTVGWSPTREIA